MRHEARRLFRATAFVAVVFVAVCGAGPARADEIVVIVNDRVSAAALTPEQVRAVFLGERQYWDGVRAFPVTYPDASPLMREFLRQVLGMGVNEFRSWWIKRIFREGDTPPMRVNSPADALQAIMANPGGIGFLHADELGGARGVHPVYHFDG